jgi:phage I-like protein
VAIIRKTDRKLVAIHSAALTNKPAIVGMQPIADLDAALTRAEGPKAPAVRAVE